MDLVENIKDNKVDYKFELLKVKSCENTCNKTIISFLYENDKFAEDKKNEMFKNEISFNLDLIDETILNVLLN